MALLLLMIGTLFASFSSMPYLRDILRHQARPRVASWAIWAVLLGIMTIAAYRDGQVASAALSAVSTIGCALIVVAGWRYGSRSLAAMDYLAIAGLAGGLVAMLFTHNAFITLAIMLLVDAVAYVPTFVHAWNEPQEESFISWSMSFIGASATLAAALVTHASIAGLLYPLYSVVFSLVMVGLLVSGRMRAGSTGYEADEA